MSELNSMAFSSPVWWFVYVGEEKGPGEEFGRWRFVHFCRAMTGGEAISSAERETRELGNEPEKTYMACATPAITIRSNQ